MTTLNEKAQQIEEIKINAESDLEAIKKAAGNVAVKQYATVFEQESNYHSIQGRNWLIATILILVATAVTGIFLAKWTIEFNESTSAQIQFTLTKIIVLAVLFYAISICTKNFRAHKHNSILNKHRQNSLQTFEAFIAAATDEQTKNAVLLQTTQSIFSNQQTGYSTGESDGEVPSKIIEIIKTAGPGTKL
jgi:uncharacterized membrane protein YhaH (DUF805 family)